VATTFAQVIWLYFRRSSGDCWIIGVQRVGIEFCSCGHVRMLINPGIWWSMHRRRVQAFSDGSLTASARS